ncbi:tetratricopeptide repeat protein [Pseudodesulfovibrio sp. zrk46]|uniref:tetratricopeptide repeat protein n=1 Tax=Pseudodesulfovibrio sp. zrk46 TaxID=2725288 RepID=UPI001448F59B|nr:tetratricopeptide repeat protein [Pseudodesulfovibrio sp. zrk46]QJB55257.1 hypothetical protein HFN16_02055 [Pseudodesulfovibrio sp. zrk46]
MKTRNIAIAALIIATAVLAAHPAFAWQSVRVGQKNFERAWSAYSFKRYDKANEYFATSADAFAKALKEYPPSRTVMFPSNLTMTGISMYHAGRYQECIKVMAKAQYKDDTIMETYLFTALSYARLGNKDETTSWLEKFIKSYPMQRTIAAEANRQLTDLQTGSPDLKAVADAIDAAAIAQFQSNRVSTGNTLNAPNEQCNGNYWWRNYRAPCESSKFPQNSN